MPKLIVVAGLPGSGKSHYLNHLEKEGIADIICHDFHFEPFHESPRVIDSRHFPTLIDKLKQGKDCVIADIVFCQEKNRQELKREVMREIPNTEIIFQCFENNPKECLKNLRRRAKERFDKEKRFVEELTTKYDAPPDLIILKVFRKIPNVNKRKNR